MIYYVSTIGDDTNAGLSRSESLRTIRKALSLAEPGDRIRIAPGTYAERQLVVVSGSGAGGYIIIEKDPKIDGEVIVDGSTVAIGDADSYAGVFGLFGVSYLEFRNLTIKHDGTNWGTNQQWTIKGIEIGAVSSAGVYGTANDLGSHHIRIIQCEFTGIKKTTHNLSYSLPLIVYSHGDERTSSSLAASTHHIEVRSCSFHDCDTFDTGRGLYHSFIELTGNVQHWIVADCDFWEDTYHKSSPFRTAGNNSSTAYPNRPRKGVYRRNRTRGMPDGYGAYIKGVHDTLCENNIYWRMGYGVGVVTEPTSFGDFDTTRRIWVRNDHAIETEVADLVVGSWSISYPEVVDVWVTTSAFVRHTWEGQSSDPASTRASAFLLGGFAGVDGITGDSKIAGNLFVSPEWLLFMSATNRSAQMLDRNLWCSPRALPFSVDAVAAAFPYDADQDANGEILVLRDVVTTLKADLSAEGVRRRAHELDKSLGQRDTPSWYEPGIFGDYA